MAIITYPIDRQVTSPVIGDIYDPDSPSLGLAFSVDLVRSLVPRFFNVGTTTTYTRATTATVEDHEGRIIEVPSNCARMRGARLVQNLITASEDMTNGAYSTFGGTTVDSATEVTFDGTANSNVSQAVTITDDGSGAGGRAFVYSAEIRLVSGTISGNDALKIKMAGNAISAAEVSIGSSVTSTAQRFAVTASTDAAGTAVTPNIESDDAITLEITNWMLEERTGMS